MGKSHPMELRSRVIAFVEEGHGHREAARHFRVSPRFVNDMVILKRESGGLLAKAQGNHAEGKLARYAIWLRDRLAQKGDLTLDEIVVEMAGVHGVSVPRGSVGKWLHRLGLSHEKRCWPAKSCGPPSCNQTRPSGAGSGLKSASRTWPRCWRGWSSSMCLIPGFDGALFSPAWRDALWVRFFTAAPPRLIPTAL